MKAHPALFEGNGREAERGKKLRNTFQRLRAEEFSSGDSAGDCLMSNILRIGMKGRGREGQTN